MLPSSFQRSMSTPLISTPTPCCRCFSHLLSHKVRRADACAAGVPGVEPHSDGRIASRTRPIGLKKRENALELTKSAAKIRFHAPPKRILNSSEISNVCSELKSDRLPDDHHTTRHGPAAAYRPGIEPRVLQSLGIPIRPAQSRPACPTVPATCKQCRGKPRLQRDAFATATAVSQPIVNLGIVSRSDKEVFLGYHISAIKPVATFARLWQASGIGNPLHWRTEYPWRV